MRRVWGLPADLIADFIPIYDDLCRFIHFVHSALNKECRKVECVVRHGLCISPMKKAVETEGCPDINTVNKSSHKPSHFRLAIAVTFSSVWQTV